MGPSPMSNKPTLDLVKLGGEMYEFCRDLFPIFRSLTGDGVRQTLLAIKKHVPELQIVEVPSGTKCFDWTVPDEWVIRGTPGSKIQREFELLIYATQIYMSLFTPSLLTKFWSLISFKNIYIQLKSNRQRFRT
jgi:hypothetical protein